MDLSVLMWNGRGINSERKQRYLGWLINEQKPDFVMINETKLTSSLYLDGYYSHQTLFKRSGGCITFTILKTTGRSRHWGPMLTGPRYP